MKNEKNVKIIPIICTCSKCGSNEQNHLEGMYKIWLLYPEAEIRFKYIAYAVNTSKGIVFFSKGKVKIDMSNEVEIGEKVE